MNCIQSLVSKFEWWLYVSIHTSTPYGVPSLHNAHRYAHVHDISLWRVSSHCSRRLCPPRNTRHLLLSGSWLSDRSDRLWLDIPLQLCATAPPISCASAKTSIADPCTCGDTNHPQHACPNSAAKEFDFYIVHAKLPPGERGGGRDWWSDWQRIATTVKLERSLY